jgi:hypothetical protein
MLGPYLRAKAAAAARLPRMLRKRTAVQRTRRVKAAAIEPLLDTTWLSTKIREKRFDANMRERVVEK